jgi:CcmD family protein
MIFLSMPRNLILAYAIAWIIHLCYLIFLGLKSRRLRREEAELDAAQDPKELGAQNRVT